MSLVRFPFEAPKIVVSKIIRYYYFFVIIMGIEKDVPERTAISEKYSDLFFTI